jgi:hypothetical protein
MVFSLSVVFILGSVPVIATLSVGLCCGERVEAPTMWCESLPEPDHVRQKLTASAGAPLLHGGSTMEHGCALVAVRFL